MTRPKFMLARVVAGLLKSVVCMLLAVDPAWHHTCFEAAVGQLRNELSRFGWKVVRWRRR